MKTSTITTIFSPLAVIVISMITATQGRAIGTPVRHYTVKGYTEEDPASKVSTGLNNKFVKIYPDAFKRDMHVVDKDTRSEVDFYVFDLQGKMMQNSKMKVNEHYRITGLAKGKYVYRVFNGDTETASGLFEIK